MSNVINSQISADISTPFVFKEESVVSLTEETLCLAGTAQKGPAFVPQQLVSFDEDSNVLNTWENIFGKYDNQEFDTGPIASKVWFDSGGEQLSYIRALGAPNTDNVGFISGDLVLSGSIDDHVKGPSKFSVPNGTYGKVHLLTSVMSNMKTDGYISPHKDYLKQLNIENSDDNTEVGIVTDFIMCTHGTSLYLQNDEIDNVNILRKKKELSTKNNSEVAFLGGISTTLKNPMIYVQGIKDSSKNTLKLNYDRFLKTNFKLDHVNEEIEWILEKGHYCYSKYRNLSNLRMQDNDNIKHLILTNNDVWNESQINYEDFRSSFKKAKTPWIVSQPLVKSSDSIQNISKKEIHKSCQKLFRFFAYDDGESGNNFRFRIIPKRKGNVNASTKFEMWSLFDVILYRYENERFVTLEHFKNLNLNPNDENYICNIIGTEHEFYNFSTQKVETKGNYRKTNNFIYVEVNEDIENEILNKDVIPCGFMPYPRLNIDNSLLNKPNTFTNDVFQNPLRYVGNHVLSNKVDNALVFEERYWGVLFDKVYTKKFKDIKIAGQSKNLMLDVKVEDSFEKNEFAFEYSKYFKNDFTDKTKNVWVEDLTDNDVDTFNSFFHLEKILYVHREDTYEKMWNCAFYQRDGRPISEIDEIDELLYKYVEVDELLSSDTLGDSIYSKYLHFDLMTYGGFDGLNILDNYKRENHDVAIMRELSEEIADETTGQIYDAYNLCFDIINNDENYLYDIFSMPGISHIDLLKKASQASKEKQFLFIADIPEILYNDADVNPNYENIYSYRLDTYHFKNPDKIEFNYLDEKDDIQYLLTQGTESTIENFKDKNFQSEYSLFVMNSIESSIRNKKDILLPPSILAINSIINKQTNQPLDSLDIESPSFVSYNNILNKYFIYNNNKFDNLLNSTKSSKTNINPLGVLAANKAIQLLSSNTAVSNNKNEYRLFHNIRIKNKIIRELKDLLTVQPILQGSSLLFNQNSNSNGLYNIKTTLLLALENLLDEYTESSLIKNYSIYIDIANLEKLSAERYLNYIVHGEINIQLFGKENNNFVRLDINKLINNINDFTSEQDIDIVNTTI